MKKLIMLAALLLLTGCAQLSAVTDTCNFTADRSATVPVADAKRIFVRAKAGELRIEGKPGLTEVQVQGTACAASAAVLEQVRLVAEQVGDEVRIVAEVPTNSSTFSVQGPQLDLVILVPEQMALMVFDGSGDTVIRSVGSVTLEDGSGDIDLSGVTGDVLVSEDGSGNMTFTDISGNVTVEVDGSGDIAANRVGGDFTVQDDGSGDISVTQVDGKVTLP